MINRPKTCCVFHIRHRSRMAKINFVGQIKIFLPHRKRLGVLRYLHDMKG